jgi:acetoin utilization deacetylase AcuC-like enzyme
MLPRQALDLDHHHGSGTQSTRMLRPSRNRYAGRRLVPQVRLGELCTLGVIHGDKHVHHV